MSLLGTLFGTQKPTSLTNAKNSLELVTSAASLLSNPRNIDPLLDQVRTITASLKPGEKPSTTDQATLFGVYLQIELYLTTKEPLRAFTKEELRSHLNEDLRQQLIIYETRG